jgi:hypothetical protein
MVRGFVVAACALAGLPAWAQDASQASGRRSDAETANARISPVSLVAARTATESTSPRAAPRMDPPNVPADMEPGVSRA